MQYSNQWNLTNCIVVENFGVDLLLGEPGKVDNKICTIPEKKSVETVNLFGEKVLVRYSSKSERGLVFCRATNSETLLVGKR